MTDLIVAKTILEQLGGNRFIVMTGAKKLIGSPDTLTFSLPKDLTKNRINRCSIKLEPSDTYKVTFYRQHGVKRQVINEVSDVYCDALITVFENETGLLTHF